MVDFKVKLDESGQEIKETKKLSSEELKQLVMYLNDSKNYKRSFTDDGQKFKIRSDTQQTDEEES